jgi:hypothetical protein
MKRATQNYMKTLVIVVALAALSGCNSSSSADHQETPGEAAGHVAYEVQKDAKKAAKEAAKDIKSFSHDAKDGFQDAKQKDAERKKAREAEGSK